MICLLMLITPWASADIASWQGPTTSPNEHSNNPSNTSYEGFKIPTNSTVTGSNFEIQPLWTQSKTNGTYWANDSPGGFSVGQSNGTSYLTSNGDLTLAPISSNGEMTDFETGFPQMAQWTISGDDIWKPVNLSLVSYGPTSSVTGSMVAGTNGSLQNDSIGIMRSKFWPVPAAVNFFNVSFERWNSLDSYDRAYIQYSVNNGLKWNTMDNFTGNSSGWVTESYPLDNLVSSASHIGFRFIIETSANSSNSVGLFLDDFNISNQGEPFRAWFHGNPSGAYLANAEGALIIPVDLSNISGASELVYWANWDIEGDYSDNLEVLISVDNNSSWTTLSAAPGVPGTGIFTTNSVFFDQSYGWREIMHSIHPWIVGHTNISNALLKFRVKTDNVVNNGGSAIDGWEGIMIDDLRVDYAIGTSNMKSIFLNNFTSTTNSLLVNTSTKPNQWQHIDWEGHNGLWYDLDSFEEIQIMPDGWRVEHIRGSSPWEIGQISNSNGYGPNNTAWPSGTNGMGINLDGIYDNEVYTHLVSPTYHIPYGSTARLTFSHWICSEADWDGGAIFTSVDDGITWQHFGGNISGFYDTISTVNGYSPFYGLGIFDGSNVIGGCGTQNDKQHFTRISGDLSHLAGNDVRVRFSFFTDTYVEEDGWYIDDAGIEIDNFQMNGSWVSPLVEATEYGWSRLTSMYWSPNGTNITVDVMDVNESIILGYEARNLPLDLDISAWKYPELKFRINYETDNETKTPRIRTLHHGMTEYITKDILRNSYSNIPEWVFNSSLVESNSTPYSITFDRDFWMPYSAVSIQCQGNASLFMNTIENRLPALGLNPPASNPNPVNIGTKSCGETITSQYGPKVATRFGVTFNPGDNFDWIKIEPKSLYHPLNVSIDLGLDNVTDWGWNNGFHYTNEIVGLDVDGQSLNPQDSRGFETTFSDNLSFSILLPARNINSAKWNCAEQLYCYNGGIKFISNQSIQPSISEENKWINHSGFEHFMTEYSFNFETTQITSFELISVNYISGFNHTISINSSLANLFIDNLDTTSSLWMNVATDRSGISFNGDIFHEKSILDSWISTPSLTYRPGLIQQAISKHQVLSGTPDLDKVDLKISTTNDLNNIIAEITLDQLDTGGRFIQHYGAGIFKLDSINSSWDGETIVWSLESSWYLDDCQRLFWFVEGTNLEGFSLGPVTTTSGTASNAAATNDLEVVQLKAWAGSTPLHDFSDQLWPFNVKGGQEISVSGEVRFSGLEGIHPISQDLELEINLYNEEELILSESTPIDSLGKFNVSFTNPIQANLSNTTLLIIPEIVSIGPSDANNARDVTATYQKITYTSDSIQSSIDNLQIVAPGGAQPADGHVWHPGQDLPLRVEVADDAGLPAKMEILLNRSGRGWESMEFLTPVGAYHAIIDLPLIDENSIPLPTEEEGWLDVYFAGFDLSGNPLSGGGTESEPLARILVQPRYPTWIDGESLGLDTTDGYLFPGKTHTFNFTISDNNGLESLDLIKFDLSKQFNGCDTDWNPWNNFVTSDVNCFIKPPIFTANKHPLTNTWDVKVEFELRWDVEPKIGTGVQTPSLRIIDENAPLGVGFTSINIHNWKIHNGIELIIYDIVDKKAPFGQQVDDVMYIHDNDIVDIKLQAYHMGSNLTAENLPFKTEFSLELIGDMNYSIKTGDLDSNGQAVLRIVFDSTYYGTQIKLIADMEDVSIHNKTGDSSNIVIDLNPPDFIVSNGYLVTIDSDSLQNVDVELKVTDDQGLLNEPVLMKWRFVRNGRIIVQTPEVAEIPVFFSSIRSNIYFDTINMEPDFELQKGDYLIIWFEGGDASGHPIQGLGVDSNSPIQTNIRWIAYEPILSDLISNPYRPELGEIITINFTFTNYGLLDGNSTIRLLDENGIILEELNLSMPVDYSHYSGFEVEAWKLGDLGLQIKIDNNSAIPVPLSAVEKAKDNASSGESILLGLAFSSFFVAAFMLIYVSSKNKSRGFFDEEE